jgi:hypothetical protein
MDLPDPTFITLKRKRKKEREKEASTVVRCFLQTSGMGFGDRLQLIPNIPYMLAPLSPPDVQDVQNMFCYIKLSKCLANSFCRARVIEVCVRSCKIDHM